MKPVEQAGSIVAYALFKLQSTGNMEQNRLINPNGYVLTLKEATDYQLMCRLKNEQWEIFCMEFPVK